MTLKSRNILNQKSNKRILVETVSIMALTASSIFVSGNVKYLLEMPAIIYIVIELLVRKRTFSQLGFKFRNLAADIYNNWYWVILVALLFQFLSLIIGKYCFPDYIAHIKSRMPQTVGSLSSTKTLIIVMIAIIFNAFVSLYEELIYRGFFLERLSWFIKPAYSVLISTLLFAAMHYTSDSPLVMLYDLCSVFADGLIYGIIYYRTKNIYASWVAHFLANIIGVVLFMKLI